MVRRITKAGFVYHEPPYTQAENDEFYRRYDSGPVAFTRPVHPAAPAAVPQQPPPGSATPRAKASRRR
jgi:hypothetical protein